MTVTRLRVEADVRAANRMSSGGVVTVATLWPAVNEAGVSHELRMVMCFDIE